MKWTGVLLASLALFTAACRAPEPPPAALQGVWTSADPVYAGRAMGIRGDTVWFEGSEGARSAHPILDTRPEDEGFAIHYGHARRPYQLRVELRLDGSLTFRNQPHTVWTRSEP